MCVNDIIVHGAKPLFLLDYIAVDKLQIDKCTEIIKGIKNGCEIANCKLVGGETAELPIIYYPNGYDVAGFTVGVIEKKQFPKDIQEGDLIFGFKSTGIHSNGFSLILELLKHYDYDLNELIRPTKIYVKEVLELINDFDEYIKGFAHITGGGIIENIPRVLPKGLNFEINKYWETDKVFNWIKEKANLDQMEMLKTFNCGIGMVVIFSKKNKNDLSEIISKYDLIEMGKVIKSEKPKVNISLFDNNNYINYDLSLLF